MTPLPVRKRARRTSLVCQSARAARAKLRLGGVNSGHLLSQLRRLGVQDQGACRLVSREASRPGLQVAFCSQCPRVTFLCVQVDPQLMSSSYEDIKLGSHPYDLT